MLRSLGSPSHNRHCCLKKPSKLSLIQGRMDWEAFRAQLDNHIDLKTRLKTRQHIDDAIHTLTTSIQHAARSSSISNPLNKSIYYLQHFVIILISWKKKVRTVWQRTKYPSDKRLFNHLINKLKRILAKIKSDNLTNHPVFLSTIDNSLWQNTRKILRSQYPVPPYEKARRYIVHQWFGKSEHFSLSLILNVQTK